MEYGWQRFVEMCLITETNSAGWNHIVDGIREKIEDKMIYSPELITEDDLKGGRVCLVDRCSRCGQPTPGSY